MSLCSCKCTHRQADRQTDTQKHRHTDTKGFSRAASLLQGWMSIFWKEMPSLFEEMLLKTMKLVDEPHETVRAVVPVLLEIFLDFPQPRCDHPVAIACGDMIARFLQDESSLVRESAVKFFKALCKEWPKVAVSIVEALPVPLCVCVCACGTRAHFTCLCGDWAAIMQFELSYLLLCSVNRLSCSDWSSRPRFLSSRKNLRSIGRSGVCTCVCARSSCVLVHALVCVCVCACDSMHAHMHAYACICKHFCHVTSLFCRSLVLSYPTLFLHHQNKPQKPKARSPMAARAACKHMRKNPSPSSWKVVACV